MDPQVSASFIPKKPLVQERGGRSGFGFLLLLALLIFIASILAAGSAFLYQNYLSASLGSKKASLEKYEEAYDLPTIQTLVRFDSRINEARKVLSNHAAPSSIFYFLSQQTLEKVQLTQFGYVIGHDGTATISLSGIANSFSTVALQSDQLGASKVLKDVVFSNIAVEPGEKVSFDVSAIVDPSLILYAKNLSANPTSPVPDEEVSIPLD